MHSIMARFIDAVRLWAETTGNKYKIPRKGTAEYVEIMGFLDELKKIEAGDAKPKKASKMSAPMGGAGASYPAPAPAPAPAPKMSKADKALAREEAKFQAGRLRAIAKDEASAMRKLARAEAKFQAGRARAIAKDDAEAMAPVMKKKRKVRIVGEEYMEPELRMISSEAKRRASAAAPAPAPARAPAEKDFTDALQSLGRLMFRRIDGGDVPEVAVRTKTNADGDKITISEVRLPNTTLQSYLEGTVEPLINHSVAGRLGWSILIKPSKISFYRPSYLELKDIGTTLMNVDEKYASKITVT